MAYEPIERIIIHHSDSSAGNAAAIRQWHKQQGWVDIGYHYVIGNGNGSGDGEIELGRDVTHMGAHCKAHNEHSVGVCLIGKFMEASPSAKQRVALVNLLAALCITFGLDPLTDIQGHRDFNATDCPGDSLYNLLDTVRNGVRLRMGT